jgi:hypothetical protein
LFYATYAIAVPKDGVFQGAHPLFAFFGVASLKMKRLVVHGDGEGAVVFVVDSDDGSFQTDAPSAGASHHFLFRLGENIFIGVT